MENPKVKRGKKSRASGAAFERSARADLESKGWIVAKWSNNVETEIKDKETKKKIKLPVEDWKLIAAKHKFRGIGIPMALGTGFPDFICYQGLVTLFRVIGVEAKSNGYLTKEEREKCVWLLENGIFSDILIASKGEKREIVYKEFK